MYSRYRQMIVVPPAPKRKKRLIPILSDIQKIEFVLLLCLVLAVPVTGYLFTQTSLYHRSKAFGFGSLLKVEGMDTAGLWSDPSGPCKSAFRLTSQTEDHIFCSPGPDPAPSGYSVNSDPAPLYAANTSFNSTSIQNGPIVTCSGDGSNGKRVEVLYVHASNIEDRSVLFKRTFRQYIADADSIFDISASETGGSRHIRFVHDSNCAPAMSVVTVSEHGNDTFANTVSELYAQGYNDPNKKYILLTDAHVYCGIATIVPDDTHGTQNKNNTGPSYARIDRGCWSGSMIAHELMHTLGGVQPSVPHATNGWHCTDEYDRMCYPDSPGYPTMTYACDDSKHDLLFDCNHDDYYTTDAAPGSYLDTHWNTAESQYLIGSPAQD